MNKLFASILGILLGIAGATILASWNWRNLIPWAIISLVVGFYSQSRKAAVWNGLCYGALLVFSFILAGYRGEMSLQGWLKAIFILALVFSIVGGILGALGAFIGNLPKKTSN